MTEKCILEVDMILEYRHFQTKLRAAHVHLCMEINGITIIVFRKNNLHKLAEKDKSNQ